MGKGSAPAPPNYAQAAQQTAQGNLDVARQQQAANMINQVTPYGNLTYAPSGTDQYGNTRYTATQTLIPSQQQILDQTTALNTGLLGTAQTGLDYANKTLASPGVDMSTLPQSPVNAGQTYQDAMMQQLQPQIDLQQKQLDTQLANQGITQGSEAWQNAQDQLARNRNNLLAQATTQGMGMGLNAQNQAFNQAAYNQNLPINIINALRTGTSVENPSYVSTPQQTPVAGPNLLGAAQAGYNSQMQGYNAQQAQGADLMNGLFGLGSAGIGAYGLMNAAPLAASDRRLKKNIIAIGKTVYGLTQYIWTYLWGEVATGVMADEVEKIMPEAVGEVCGYKYVNYGMLYGR